LNLTVKFSSSFFIVGSNILSRSLHSNTLNLCSPLRDRGRQGEKNRLSIFENNSDFEQTRGSNLRS
jgi:hypothetical protein